MSERNQPSMAPDSHTDNAGPVQLIAGMTISSGTSSHAAAHQQTERCAITTSPLPNGILFKGKKTKKRVSFRDSHLVNIREIPPRSSSGDEDSEDEDVAGSSESEEDTDSDSEEEEEVTLQQVPVVVNGREKTVTLSVSRASHSPPVSTLTVRPERAPIPWTAVSSFTGPKAAHNDPVSPTSKVVSMMSQITDISSSTTQTYIKQRSAAVGTSSPSPSPSPGHKPPSPSPVHHKAPSPIPPKKAPVVMRVEKKVKKITPTMDNVMTSQTVRSVQKHGTVPEALHKGNTAKTGKKKRVLQRRQEASEKRKATTPSRKNKDSKHSNSKAHETSASRQTSNGMRTVSSAAARPKVRVSGFASVRDSLSLPPLSTTDDSVLLNPAKLQQQQRPVTKTSVYSVDGFIFPGDPTHDFAAGLRASAAASGAEEVKVKPQVPPTTSIPGGYPLRDLLPGHPVRDRANSAPPSSASRRKRFYAWQMANGNLQSSLHEPPNITPLWETMTPAPAPTPKPAYVADR